MKIKIILCLCTAFLLTGCPATMNVDLTNDASSDISVLYVTGHESKIKAGGAKNENYLVNCIRIIREEEMYEFQNDRPPSNYVSKRLFSTLVNGVFTEENELMLYIESDPTSFIELEPGC